MIFKKPVYQQTQDVFISKASEQRFLPFEIDIIHFNTEIETFKITRKSEMHCSIPALREIQRVRRKNRKVKNYWKKVANEFNLIKDHKDETLVTELEPIIDDTPTSINEMAQKTATFPEPAGDCDTLLCIEEMAEMIESAQPYSSLVFLFLVTGEDNINSRSDWQTALRNFKFCVDDNIKHKHLQIKSNVIVF